MALSLSMVDVFFSSGRRIKRFKCDWSSDVWSSDVIILIIAATAIPNLFRAKMAANESSATAAIRVINTAQVSYKDTSPPESYSLSLHAVLPTSAACAPPALSTVAQACIIDELLSGFGPVPFVKSGYTFGMVPGASFFNDTATSDMYAPPLRDALPI